MRKANVTQPAVNPNPLNKPIPGWSLTQPAKKWNWEQPPRHANVNGAVDAIIDRLEMPEVETRYIKLMLAGISVEEIVHSISMAGFMEGEFSPDVAEIIKGPLGIYFLGLAAENDIPVEMFAKPDPEERENPGLDDMTLMELMRSRNPSLYAFLQDKQNKDMDEMTALQEKMGGGFMGMDEDELPEEEGMEEVEMPEEEMMEELPEEELEDEETEEEEE